MGPRSEPFARQTLRVLEQNPGIVPPRPGPAARALVTVGCAPGPDERRRESAS
jgi:hypothetical protein